MLSRVSAQCVAWVFPCSKCSLVDVVDVWKHTDTFEANNVVLEWLATHKVRSGYETNMNQILAITPF